ncbi:MAG: peptidylprolyl isomerase [Fimbriimonadales bacterium]|nr:peptidylprolyl isomerase [Fimbriimonadales bacterium]MDW8052124.1 peptidylprolyl isomerase [Armatimonadota bacterium]
MPRITVRTFRELLKRRLVKGLGLIVLIVISLSMVIFFAIPPGAPVQTEVAGLNDPVVKVGDVVLTEGDLQRLINLQTQDNPPAEYGALLQLRYQLARSFAEAMAFTLELEKQGYTASEAEIEAAREQFIKARLDQLRAQLLPEGKGDDRALDKALRERGSSLRRVREQLLAETPEFLFRLQVVQDKFRKSAQQKYNPTDEQLRLMFEQVYPARIFVSIEKHKDKAQARIQAAYNALKAGKPFAEVVKQYSDDPEFIKKQGGRLPGSGYYEIQEQLSNLFGAEVATRVLAFKPNKDYTEPLQDKEKKGYYIYAIAERKMQPPEDFEKNKEGYRQAFINMRLGREDARIRIAARQNFKPQIVDPILAQYEKVDQLFLTNAPVPQRIKVYKEVSEALAPIVASANPNVRLAQWLQINVLNSLVNLYKQVKDKQNEKKYREQLNAAINRFFNEGGEDLTIRLLRAQLLIEAGKKQSALNDLEVAEGLVARPSEFPYLFQVAQLYEQAGRKDKAQQLTKRAEDMRRELQRQQEEMIRRQIEAFRKQQEEERKKQQAAQKQPRQPNQAPSQGAPQTNQLPAGQQGATQPNQPTAEQPGAQRKTSASPAKNPVPAQPQPNRSANPAPAGQ